MDTLNTPSANRSASCLGARLVASPAKLNLGLSIVGRRNDGLHELESLFWPIDLADQLRFTPHSNTKVFVEGTKHFIDEKDNLAYRAAQSVSTFPCTIHLDKKIPIGGGLGGGSSNAGTVLRELGSNENQTELLEKACSLGADVPFFLDPKPAWVCGIGEVIHSLQVDPDLLSSLSFLVVLPPLSIETKQIFTQYRQSGVAFSGSRPKLKPLLYMSDLEAYLASAQNDLEPIVCKTYPLIDEILSQLRLSPCLYAGLSGTGSTCFAVYSQPLKKIPKELLSFFRKAHCRSVIAKTFIKG